MTIEKRLIAAALVACVASLVSSPLLAQESKGKILIVLSSEHVLPLKDGKTFETGYYLNELTVPAQKFAEAGYELVFADPKGNVPAVDQSSISTDYFGGSQEALESAQRFQGTLTGLSHPLTSGPAPIQSDICAGWTRPDDRSHGERRPRFHSPVLSRPSPNDGTFVPRSDRAVVRNACPGCEPSSVASR